MTSEDVTLYSFTYRSWRVGSIKTRIGHFRKEARIILWIGK